MSDISVTLPPEEDPLWLFTREEIDNSPSRADQVSQEEEDECRKGASVFIQSVGVQLRLPQLTMATALLFYHRFFALRSLKQYPLLDMSTACLFVAAKLEETPKKLKELVVIAHSIQFPDQPPLSIDSPEFKRERDRILSLERELLQTLCFDFQIDHPYRYLLLYVKQLHGGKELAQSAWSFANDSFRTTLPLQYYARIIGAGCVYLATKKMLPDKMMMDHEEWFKIFGVDISILEDIGRQLMDLYKGSKTEVEQQQQQQVSVMVHEDNEKKSVNITAVDSTITSIEPGISSVESPLPTTLIDNLEKKTVISLSPPCDEPMIITSDDSVSKSHEANRSEQELTILGKDDVRLDSHTKRPIDSHHYPHPIDKQPSMNSRRPSKSDRYEKPASSYRDSHHYQRRRSRDRSRDRRRDNLDEIEDYSKKRYSHYDDDHTDEDYYRRRSPYHRYHDDDHHYHEDEVDDYHRGRMDHDYYYYHHHPAHHSKQSTKHRDDYSRDRQSRRRH